MQKPGLGARKCGHCGARIEGPQSHTLQQCPNCRSPLYGRFVPAPTQLSPGQQPKSGGAGVILAILGVGGLGIVVAGVIGVIALGKKGTASPETAPPGTTAPTPLLAETADAAVAAATAKPKPTAAATGTTKPVPAVSGNIFGNPTTTPTITPPIVPSSSLAFSGPVGSKCNVQVSVGKFKPSSSTCSFNEKVSRGPARMEFPCGGGEATAPFSTQVFRGSVSGNSITLSNVEEFDFRGCTVASTQRILGSKTTLAGVYNYSERIVRGNCGGVSTCTASAPVEFR